MEPSKNQEKALRVSAGVGALKQVDCDLLAIPVFKGKDWAKVELGSLPAGVRGKLEDLAKLERFEGDYGAHLSFFTQGSIKAHEVLIFGLGEQTKATLDLFRKAAGQMTRLAVAKNASHLALAVPSIDASGYRYNTSPEEMAQALTEGAMLGCYRFLKYKKPKKVQREITSLQIVGSHKDLERSLKLGIDRGRIHALATAKARNLINEPPSSLPPLELAKRAQQILRGTGVKVTILQKREIQRLGMNAYLAVSWGSTEPPAMIRMEYVPKGKAKSHVALIGKGVTFDSGGLSIKGAKSMETMKDDMSGAAAVIGTLWGLSQLKPDVRVTGLILATENMPDGAAVKPGDVVTAYTGKTIEILNTDAEGRLTLADALSYTEDRIKPDQMIDIATLTGACLVALGDSISALLGNTRTFNQALQDAGTRAGEVFWEMPLHEDYRDQIKSDIADIKNTGGSYGGTLTAALFLSEFVDKCPWVHLDIAGPAWSDRESGYLSKGGTGVGVRTFLTYLCSL